MLFDLVWYERHLVSEDKKRRRQVAVDPEVLKQALASAAKIRAQYGKKAFGPYTDFEWGMINGKLSAIRWVLGEDWDFLDT